MKGMILVLVFVASVYMADCATVKRQSSAKESEVDSLSANAPFVQIHERGVEHNQNMGETKDTKSVDQTLTYVPQDLLQQYYTQQGGIYGQTRDVLNNPAFDQTLHSTFIPQSSQQYDSRASGSSVAAFGDKFSTQDAKSAESVVTNDVVQQYLNGAVGGDDARLKSAEQGGIFLPQNFIQQYVAGAGQPDASVHQYSGPYPTGYPVPSGLALPAGPTHYEYSFIPQNYPVAHAGHQVAYGIDNRPLPPGFTVQTGYEGYLVPVPQTHLGKDHSILKELLKLLLAPFHALHKLVTKFIFVIGKFSAGAGAGAAGLAVLGLLGVLVCKHTHICKKLWHKKEEALDVATDMVNSALGKYHKLQDKIADKAKEHKEKHKAKEHHDDNELSLEPYTKPSADHEGDKYEKTADDTP